MKKFISFFSAIAVAASYAVVPAYAQDKDVTLTVSGSGLCTSFTDGESNIAVLSFYNNDKLVYSTMASSENGQYTFTVDESYYNDYARIGYIGGGVYDAVIEKSQEEPVETETPAATASPTETTEPEKTPYPAIYPKPIDAINAPMVVKKNEAAMVDGEEYYKLTVLYQGAETTVSVRGGAEIKSAPDSASYLIGNNASVLKEGDVIHMTAYMSGMIKSIEFIYRPEKTDYVKSEYDGGTDFKLLYSAGGKTAGSWNAIGYNGTAAEGDGYIFGVPVKTEKGYILLANKEGKVKEVSIASGTIVYTVNNAAKSNKTEFSGFGYAAIGRTFVPGNDFYESIIDWTDVDDITYALVKVTDGVATDIVVFTN